MSAEDYIKANARFRPWKRKEAMMRSLGEDWHDHEISVRTAYAMMAVPQRNLLQIHEEVMTESQVDQMMANICRTAELLKIAASFMDLSLIRLIAAGSVAEARGTLRVR